MIKSYLFDRSSQAQRIRDKTFMSCFVTAEPEKITENRCKNLEKMSVFLRDTEEAGRVKNPFNPVSYIQVGPSKRV
ncbi:hypothetical protein SLA2020_365580 [Shorea laevis]